MSRGIGSESCVGCGNVLLRSVDSVVAGLAIQHRKTEYPEDDVVTVTEVNTLVIVNGKRTNALAVSARTNHAIQR